MKYSLRNIIECLLLVSDEPLSISQIAKILDDKIFFCPVGPISFIINCLENLSI